MSRVRPIDRPEYGHRACESCGQPIPRWTDGRPTIATKVFCNAACRMHRQRAQGLKKTFPATGVAPVRESANLMPISSALSEPDSGEVGRPQYRIVAGPVDHCAQCHSPIMPRNPGGIITPYSKGNALFCDKACADARPATGGHGLNATLVPADAVYEPV
jgi:hypothetical protein